MLKRLSYPMESITSISRILTSSPKSVVDFTGSLFSGRGSEEEVLKEDAKEEQEHSQTEAPKEPQKKPPEVGYQNLVEEKPEIFEQLDSEWQFCTNFWVAIQTESTILSLVWNPLFCIMGSSPY